MHSLVPVRYVNRAVRGANIHQIGSILSPVGRIRSYFIRASRRTTTDPLDGITVRSARKAAYVAENRRVTRSRTRLGGGAPPNGRVVLVVAGNLVARQPKLGGASIALVRASGVSCLLLAQKSRGPPSESAPQQIREGGGPRNRAGSAESKLLSAFATGLAGS